MKTPPSALVAKSALILSLLAAACGRGQPATPQAPTEAPEPTAVPRVCDGKCQGAVMAAVDIIDTSGFHGMSEGLAEAAAVSRMAPALGVMVAQDMIDAVGFHALQEEIEAATSMEDVSPRNLGRVQSALAASKAAPYPDPASEALAAFQESAEALVAALEAGDLEAAQAAVAEAHHTQHELSGQAFAWLSGQDAEPGEGLLAVVSVLGAQDVVDSAGFHGMSEEIVGASSMEDISPRNVGTLKNALAASRAAAYPEALGEELAAFQADAQALIKALESGELEAAKEVAEAIHASQHSLSSAAFAWLGEQSGASGEGLASVLSAMAAQDIIDNTGFHGIQEEIEAASSIEGVNPRTTGNVDRALRASLAASYPEDVHGLAAFQEAAQALIQALEEGNLEAAKEVAAEVHHTQHELSGQVGEFVQAQDSGTLSASLISSRDLSTARTTHSIVGAVDWPGALTSDASAFQADLEALIVAMQAGDVGKAAEAGQAIHESQHGLSHSAYHWLGEQVAQTDQVDAMLAAIDIIDSAGFHAMAEEIAEASSMEEVSPRSAGRVENARIAATVVEWPGELSGTARAFRADAQALVAALEAGELEAAREASGAIHGSQHDFSHAAYEFFAANAGAAGGLGAMLAAQDVIDSSGFHGMAHDLEHAASMQDVNPRYLSTVEKALISAKLVSWPSALAEASEMAISDLEGLAEALESGDLQSAQAASGAVHASQHALSHDVYHLVGEDISVVESRESEPEESEPAESEEDELPPEYADAEVLNLIVNDWSWDPTSIEVTVGEPVVLAITNEGKMPHGIWVPQLNINVETAPGQVTLVPVTPQETGEFVILCSNDLCGTAEQHANMLAKIVVSD